MGVVDYPLLLFVINFIIALIVQRQLSFLKITETLKSDLFLLSMAPFSPQENTDVQNLSQTYLRLNEIIYGKGTH